MLIVRAFLFEPRTITYFDLSLTVSLQIVPLPM